MKDCNSRAAGANTHHRLQDEPQIYRVISTTILPLLLSQTQSLRYNLHDVHVYSFTNDETNSSLFGFQITEFIRNILWHPVHGMQPPLQYIGYFPTEHLSSSSNRDKVRN